MEIPGRYLSEYEAYGKIVTVVVAIAVLLLLLIVEMLRNANVQRERAARDQFEREQYQGDEKDDPARGVDG